MGGPHPRSRPISFSIRIAFPIIVVLVFFFGRLYFKGRRLAVLPDLLEAAAKRKRPQVKAVASLAVFEIIR